MAIRFLKGQAITGTLSVSSTTTLAAATVSAPSTSDDSTRIPSTAWVKDQNYITSGSLPTVNNATITFTAGTGLTGGGTITLNQSSNETVAFNNSITNNNQLTNGANYTTNTGTVTSVSQTHAGNAFDVSGSPITASGTLAIDVVGTSSQYINGAGNLITFPSIPQGDITNVSTTSPITGGGSSGSVTIAHANSGASAGSYTNANVTVNATGHVTSVSSGSDAQGVTSVATTNGITGGTITSTGTIQLDSTVVRTTGTQTIGGAKTFSDDVTISGATKNLNIFNTAETQAGIVFSDTQAGTSQRAAIKFDSSSETLDFFMNDEPNERMSIDTAGTLIINGGIISLGATGRIKGIDTVSVGTDAANKTYVDNAIAGVPQGDITAVVAGTGLSGGGTSGSVTLNNTITNNNQLTNGAGYTTNTGTTTASNSQTFTNKGGNISQWTNDSGYTTSVGDITAVVAGTGLSGGGTSGSVTLNNTITNNNQLTNGAGYTTNVGDITAVSAGSGMSGGGTSGAVTLTNADKGSSQNIYKNIAVSGQSTVVADSNNDTLTLVASGGMTITTNATTDTITFNPNDDNDNYYVTGASQSGGTLTLTRQGLSTLTATGFTNASNSQTFTNKSGNISQWTNNSGYITAGSLPTVNNATITLSAGTGLSGGGTITLNQASNETVIFNNTITNNNQLTNGAGYTTNTGTTTASNSQTFTNKGGNISQWTNDSGYVTSSGGSMSSWILKEGNGSETSTVTNGETVTFSQAGLLETELVSTTSGGTLRITNTCTNNNQLTNGAGYTTNVGDITGVTAGTNMSGGGTSGTVTLNCTITNNNQLTNGAGYTTNTGTTTPSNTQTFTNKSGNISQWTNNSGYITSASLPTVNDGVLTMTTSTGLDGGAVFGANQSGASLFAVTLDLSELTDMTATMNTNDEFIVLDSSAERRKRAGEIGLSIFNNDAGFTTNVGDITGVTAGTGMSGGGTSGTVTLNCTVPVITNNNQLTNGAGYTTSVGDITGVTAGTNMSGGGTSGTVTLNCTITNNNQLTNGAGYTTNTGTTTASNTQTFTNKSGNISQWSNNSGYTTNTGTTTASNTQTFTNKSGNISQWTNDAGYVTSTGSNNFVTGGNVTSGTVTLNRTGLSNVSFTINNSQITNGAGYTTNTGTVTGSGASNRVAFWNSSSGITSDSDLTFNGSSLTVGGTITSTQGNFAANGEEVMSNAAASDTLLIGDAAESDGVSQIQLKTAGATQMTVDDGEVIINSGVNFKMEGGRIQFNSDTNIQLDAALSSNQSSGTVLPIGNTTVTAGKVYYWDGGWTQTDADSETKSKGLLAFAKSSGTASVGRMVLEGIVHYPSFFAAGSVFYLSTVEGEMQFSAPSGTNDVARVVAYVIDSNHIYFKPDNTWVKIT